MESERWINNCFMAAPAGHRFFLDCMESMDTIAFDKPEIELETGPRLVTDLVQQNTGWKPKKMNIIEAYRYGNGIVKVYPERYFSPFRWYQKFTPDCITPDTITVHHYCHSWGKKC
jgi:hypothetical protein